MTPNIEIGIQLPEIERIVPWREYAELAIAAEAAGFDSLWVGDHLLYDKPEGPRGPWECWSILAGLAAITERPLLGPLVSPTGFRNPALLAKMAGTVDEISGGRVVLGLGAGWNRREFDAFGLPYQNRVSRFEEAFAIIVDLIRTGSSTRQGRYHRTDHLHLVPPVRSDLPIMIGSTGPRMLAITAPQMDWWNEWWNRFDNSPVGLRPVIARLDAALRRAGRDPADVTKSVAVFVQMPGGSGRLMGAETRAPPITGDTHELGRTLAAFAGLVDHLQLVVDPITRGSIEALAPVVELVHAAA